MTKTASAESHIATALTQARERAGLTKYALAQQSGVNATLIGRVESGARSLTLDTAQRLTEALGVSLAVFDRPKKFREKQG